MFWRNSLDLSAACCSGSSVRAIRSRVPAQYEHCCEGTFSSPSTKTCTNHLRSSPGTCELKPVTCYGTPRPKTFPLWCNGHILCVIESILDVCSVAFSVGHSIHELAPAVCGHLVGSLMLAPYNGICSRIEVVFLPSLPIPTVCRFPEFSAWKIDAAWSAFVVWGVGASGVILLLFIMYSFALNLSHFDFAVSEKFSTFDI